LIPKGNNVELIAYIILGILIGGVVVWFLAKARFQGVYAKQMAEFEGDIKGAEAVNSELRKQIEQKDSEINQIRNELSTERQSKVEAITRLEESQKNLAEQKTLLEAMKTEMTDTFNALSSAALKSSSEDFLRLASEHLGKVVAETKGKLGEHQAAIDGLIKPLNEALKRYEEQVKQIEESRHKAYGSLEEQLRALASTQEQLQKETSNLVSALKRPQVRGRWGEITLRRVAELSGMSAHCDFTEQISVETESGRLRPDMIVHLPMEREIVVDAKVSLDAYLDALSATAEDERKSKMDKHAQQVRAHMNRLASKEYWNQFKQSPEFVVLFIPGESFLSSALEVDSTLIEDGIQKRVIIATPTTFIALLRAIAYGWRQEQMTKNAQEISILGKELYDRINIWVRHINEIGTALGRALDAYNRSVGSMDSRVLPSVRKFKELGVTSEEIPVLEQIDKIPRSLSLLESETDEGK
jgi:DNA recombination protein RmuC